MSETKFDGVAASYQTSHADATRLSGEDATGLPIIKRARETIALLSRYLAVGLVNTAIGYSIILIGLRLGMGDYLANAAGYIVGLAVSYVLQRRWAFAVSTPPSVREAGRFCAAALLAYGANLAVIHLARSMGYVGSPIAQAVAMVAYSMTFFVLSRFVVFARASSSTDKNGEMG
jgi:putative flippase GtrA